MARKNKYWRERVEAEQGAKIERDRSLSDEMDRLYTYHFNELEKEIRAFYERYSIKEHLPVAEVKKRVDDMDVKAFEDKAKRYVAEKDFSAKANRELGLYNLKMKVNRLELLQYNMDLEMLVLSEGEHKMTERFLDDEYTSEVKNQAGLLGQSVATSNQIEQVAKTVINTSFNGAKWSDRIWERQTALRQIVARATEDLLLKGKNPTRIIPQLRREFNVSANQAKRLAVTEGARVQTEAQKQSLLENGFDEYEFMAEPRACDICRPLNGKIFKVSKMIPGENAAPMHPFCRCSTVAHYSKSQEEYERLLDETWHSVYPHMDNVTNKWLAKVKKTADIDIQNSITRDGITYVVDGKKVVMDHDNHEYQVATWLSKQLGKQVKLLPRVTGVKSVSSPDYLIDGVFWDLKSPTGSGKYMIDGNLRKTKKQTRNIIFDITNNPLSNQEIMQQLDDVYKWGRRDLATVIIKKGDELLYVTEPKKKG